MSWHYIFLDVVLEYQALYRWVDLRFCRRVGYWLSVCLVVLCVGVGVGVGISDE